MKSLSGLGTVDGAKSHPTRGAWIEICDEQGRKNRMGRSHPTRGAWIEINAGAEPNLTVCWSHPTRGAWIEITAGEQRWPTAWVAPHTGCVD